MAPSARSGEEAGIVTLGEILLAIGEDPDRQVKSYSIFGLQLSARHLVIALITAISLPQILLPDEHSRASQDTSTDYTGK